MEDKEKFGVEIEAITSGFKKEMQNLARDSQKIGEEIKKNLSIDLDDAEIDFDYIIEEVKKRKSELDKAFKNIGVDFDIPNLLDSKFSKQINYVEEQIDKLKEELSELDGPFGSAEIEAKIEKLNNALDELYKKEALTFNTTQAEKQLDILRQKIENINKVMRAVDKGEIDLGGYGIDISQLEETARRFHRQLLITKDAMKEVQEKGEETSNVFKNLGKNISDGFKNVTKNIKRLTFSLVGVHSAYRIITRAVSAYSQYDIEYTQKMKSAWASLGAFLAPLTSMIGTAVQKMVGYLNVFIKALTGVDYIKKANDAYKYSKAIKSIGKSAKEALTPLDEITNIQDNATGSSADDDFNPFEAIQNVELDQSWVDKLTDIGIKLRPIYDIIKQIIDWSVQHPEVLLAILGGMAIIKTISSILGIFGVGAGAKGLLGILGVLGAIIGIGEIVLEMNGSSIKKVLKDVSELYDIWVSLNNGWNTLGKKYEENNKKNMNWAEEFDSSIEEHNDKLKNDINMANGLITTMSEATKEYNEMGVAGRLLRPEHAKEIQTQFETAVKGVKSYIDYQKELYKQGKLTDDEIVDLNDTIIAYNEALKNAGYSNEKMIGTFRLGKEKAQEMRDEYSENTEILDGMTGKVRRLGEQILKLPSGKEIKINVNTEEARKNINKLIDDINKSLNSDTFKISLGVGAGLAGLIKGIPSYDVGTPYVPEDGLAMIHKGERIIPAQYNNESLFDGKNNETTNALLVELIEAVEENGEKVPVFNLNGKEFARATYNDFENEKYSRNKNTVIRRV